MSRLKGLLQRSLACIKHAVDPVYAEGARLYATGTTADKAALEAIQFARLKPLLAEFHRCGLFQLPGGDNGGRVSSLSDLAKLPVLSRLDLNKQFPRLERVHAERPDVFTFTTGGSTGEPVRFIHSRRQQTLAGSVRLQLDITLGWRPGMPRLALWRPYAGNIVPASEQTRSLRTSLRHYLSGSTYFGGYCPTEQDYARFLDAVRTHQGCAIWGYASVLEDCARFALERDQVFHTGFIAAAWNCGEMMYEKQKQTIERVFGIAPREFYSSRECSGLGVECDHGSIHISPRYIVEVVDKETHTQLAPGETGLLLFTDLFNDVTPFIRYAIGDLGAISWRDCACGWRGPCLEQLAGRSTWLITLPSGKKISTGIFAAIGRHVPELHQWTVVRLSLDGFEVRYTGEVLDGGVQRDFLAALAVELEGASFRMTHVDELQRAPSGKLLQYVDLTETRATQATGSH